MHKRAPLAQEEQLLMRSFALRDELPGCVSICQPEFGVVST